MHDIYILCKININTHNPFSYACKIYISSQRVASPWQQEVSLEVLGRVSCLDSITNVSLYQFHILNDLNFYNPPKGSYFCIVFREWRQHLFVVAVFAWSYVITKLCIAFDFVSPRVQSIHIQCNTIIQSLVTFAHAMAWIGTCVQKGRIVVLRRFQQPRSYREDRTCTVLTLGDNQTKGRRFTLNFRRKKDAPTVNWATQ